MEKEEKKKGAKDIVKGIVIAINAKGKEDEEEEGEEDESESEGMSCPHCGKKLK